MQKVSKIVGVLLGLLFITFALNYFFPFLPPKAAPAAGSPPALFFGALIPTHYFAFIKIVELIGGLLVLCPSTRNIGLLFLGPVIVNILAFHILLENGYGLVGVPLLVAVLAAFLLWDGRKKFAGLLNCCTCNSNKKDHE